MIIGGIGTLELSLNITQKMFSSSVDKKDLLHLALLSGEIEKNMFEVQNSILSSSLYILKQVTETSRKCFMN